MEPKCLPHCDTFCTHQSCWERFVKYLKSIDNYDDEDHSSKQSDAQSQSMTCGTTDDIRSENGSKLDKNLRNIF